MNFVKYRPCPKRKGVVGVFFVKKNSVLYFFLIFFICTFADVKSAKIGCISCKIAN